ncbi:hypothetical protein AU255_09790 [Methyloprofundus sedimenti]|uniref:DUF2380 domain-containing protein n=1 Tax=Methyloprofundus sedimenti TaxID=1420851 RepID=A0A1V8MB06_9GAMM|nr:DUF2380 domain-containing protein [Methyloprofundus sedimenti]OQK18735.1 hypothetical protein AU255_09790 [Methyloprofundus sedimenti]
MNIIKGIVAPGLLLFMLLIFGTANAAERIAILSFELNDITSLPNTLAEQIRTASIKPLLEQAMIQTGEYEIIQISPEQQKASNAGFGYLFSFHDIAAKLGKGVNADWIIVGQHSKPSFLFSYLIAHVINAHTGKSVARYDIELKGNHEKVMQRGVRKLAREIDRVIVGLGKGD